MYPDFVHKLLTLAKDVLGGQDIESSARELLEQVRQVVPGIGIIGVFGINDKGNVSLIHVKGLEESEADNLTKLGEMESLVEMVRKNKSWINLRREEGNCLVGVPLYTRKGIKGVLTFFINSSNCGEINFSELVPFVQAIAVPFTGELVNSELYSQLEELFLSTILALASAVDAKHPYTRGHSERVTRYSVAIAREMGLSRQEVKDLQISALLHDVGKIGISETVLDKNGKLTQEEYEKIKQHPVIGAEIVGKIANSERIVPGILEHHERYDGKGYPYGKKGDEISLFGRIIAVADTFDAMTSTRSYRKALPFQVAVEEIVYNAGYQFDPKVVKFFVQAYEKEKDIWQRENIILSVR